MSQIDRKEIGAIYPLSPLQQGLVLHNLLAPESGVYAVQYFCTLAGELDPEAFRDAWTSVVARHDVLRTLFVLDQADRPLQVVLKHVDLPWRCEDWRGTDPATHAAAFRALLDADRLDRFDLERAPLFRLALIRTGADTHRFLWSVHHSIVDGWSISRVLGEVFALYQARIRHQPLSLPSTRPYSEFIAWLGKQDPAAAEQYWRAVLDGFSAPTPVPGEERLTSDAAAVPEKHHFALDARTTGLLQTLARTEGLTLNTIVQAAWALLLSRYTGEQDVVFGATVAGRPASLPDSDRMVGLFINTLPVRVRFDPDEPIGDCLRRLQREQVQAREYEYASLVDIQSWSQVPRGRALFDTLLLYENFPAIAASDRNGGSDLRITGANSHDATHYALTLSVVPSESLALRLMYDPGRFRAETIRRMAAHLQRLLQSLASSVRERTALLPMLDDDERRQILIDWNDTRVPYRRDHCVHRQFEEQARRDSVAVIGESGSVTYSELNRRANRIAHRLIELGVGPDVLVAIAVERTPDMIAALFGVLKAGGAYVPLDPAYPRDRLAYMVEDARIRVLITEQALGNALPAFAGPTLYLDRHEAFERYPTGDPERAIAPDNLAYVIYTSGSTGRPKGVQVSHGALASFLAAMRRQPGLSEHDSLLAVTTLSFDIAGLEIYLPLTAGARVMLAGRETSGDAAQLAAAIARLRPTVMQATPATWRMLIEAGWQGAPGMKILCGGEALPGDLAARLLERGASLWNLYGPTETTIWSTICEVRTGDGPVSIGRPIANTITYVLDRSLQPVPVGAMGELYIGGAGVARGYLNRPDLTAERFVPDPFGDVPGARIYRTGDVVRHRADGSIEYVGRADHQIKLRGFRIELGEIEAVLTRHEGVRQAVAIIREDDPGDPRLVAYVTAVPGASVSAAELHERAAQTLPQYMVPSACVLLDAFPMTPNGKVDRKALPAPEGARQLQHELVSPRTALEERLAAVWRDVLRVQEVGVRDSFFDLGGNSLLLMRVHVRLTEALGRKIPLTDLFRYPTIELLARALGAESDRPRHSGTAERAVRRPSAGVEPIAVVGMAGRFPGADDVDAFWRNIAGAVECIRFFSDDELRQAGIPEHVLADPRYVKARGVLDGADLFDAPFFGYTPREAELMDPQQRVFLECAWEALERAGYSAREFEGSIGVYAGSSINTYAFNLLGRPDVLREIGAVGALLSLDRDYLPMRVSYKLNLRGPSVNVQTACSTSLVAVHQACQSLLADECDVALAGGVAIAVPLASGYFYNEGGIMSPDGHCRAFDARAAGTLGGSGVGVVVLKRLSRALSDGDVIHAVVRGTAVNNDGSVKVGFTAPSVGGQSNVIAAAHAAASTDPSTVGYVETHGTGTALGDPVEVQALTQAFSGSARERRTCAIGSVKTNVGHLDAAAGVASLIKTVLALKYRQLPPSLHFDAANPHIDFDSGPFYVNTVLRPWDDPPEGVRRAGVSSFGLGGTNAHAVLEEAPEPPPSGPGREWQMLVLSAKSDAALDAQAERLAGHLRANPEASLADIAYTLQVGREGFDCRRAIVSRDVPGAMDALEGRDRHRAWKARTGARPSVVMMFPGQGSQYVGMARELYDGEPLFRQIADECADRLRPALGADLREILWPSSSEGRALAETAMSQRSQVAQASLFVVEYALARVLIAWGVEPDAMIGHSIGEYVAACLSGVLTLDDALKLVAVRGGLMDRAPAGCMTAVPASESRVRSLLGDGLSLAAVNAPEMCVVAGRPDAIEAFEARLAAEGIETQRLHTAGAFHSELMRGVEQPLRQAARDVRPGKPAIPYVSNVTGTFAGAEIEDSGYWSRHVTGTVRFADGISAVLSAKANVFLEVGPGQVLGAFVRQAAGSGATVLATLRHAKEPKSDLEGVTAALARLWVNGVTPRWTAYHDGERRRRVELPTYPFERERYWIDASARSAAAASQPGVPGKNTDVATWFYTPEWQSQPGARFDREAVRDAGPWLVFADATGLGRRLAAEVIACGGQAAVVEPGEGFSAAGSAYRVSPDRPDDFDALVAELQRMNRFPGAVLHAWAFAAGENGAHDLVDRAYTSLVQFVRACGAVGVGLPRVVGVVTSGVHRVIGDELMSPEAATALGPALVIPVEHPGVRCRAVDLAAGEWTPDSPVQSLLATVLDGTGPAVIALRRGRSWVRAFHQERLEAASAASRLKHRGVYLITGGYGGMGLELATYLAETYAARLVLTGREGLPERSTWAVHRDGANARLKRRIEAVEALERRGAEVMTAAADVTDESAMQRVVQQALERFGRIDGAIHAAGIAGARIMQLDDGRESRDVLAPKVTGTQVLLGALAEARPDFVVLCSSVSTLAGGMGQASYTAANAYLDAVAQAGYGTTPAVVAINWDAWQEVGMAVDTNLPDRLARARAEELKQGILPAEGRDVLARALQHGVGPQLVVSTRALGPRLQAAAAAEQASQQPERSASHSRPDLAQAYVAPRNPIEEEVADVWQRLFGIARVGVEDDFFELGGHSLLATQLMSRVRERFQVDLPLAALFEAPTVSGLSLAVMERLLDLEQTAQS